MSIHQSSKGSICTLLFVCAFILVSCSAPSTPEPTATPLPTITATLTNSPNPTDTPKPATTSTPDRETRKAELRTTRLAITQAFATSKALTPTRTPRPTQAPTKIPTSTPTNISTLYADSLWGINIFFDENTVFSAAQVTDQGEFILVGYTDTGDDKTAALVVKLNADSSIAWQRTFHDTSGYPALYSVAVSPNGSFVVAGDIQESKAWALKLDPDGNPIWKYTYFHENGPTSIRQITPAPNGGYFFVGKIEDCDSYPGIWVGHIKDDGSLGWHKAILRMGLDEAFSIHSALNGGFIISGTADSMISPDLQAYKFDRWGHPSWHKIYGTREMDLGGTVWATRDGGYLMHGISATFGSATWLLKVDRNGKIQWQKRFGPNLIADQLLETKDTNILFSGNGFLIKLDHNGQIIWQQYLGNDKTHALIELGNGDIVILSGAYRKYSDRYPFNMSLVKVNSDGEIPNCDVLLSPGETEEIEAAAAWADSSSDDEYWIDEYEISILDSDVYTKEVQTQIDYWCMFNP